MQTFHQLLSAFVILFLYSCNQPKQPELFGSRDWPEYLGGPERAHYSLLEQINRDNVTKLQPAWEYHTGDTGQIQCSPIMVNNILYSMTATVQAFAVDAATGKEIWRSGVPGGDGFSTSRGVSYWQDENDQRILYSSGEWLYALNAATGKRIASFGDSGKVSLKTGLGAVAAEKMVISNTPGTIFENLIVMPLRMSEGADAAAGHIQAFDVRTGKLAWVFHTIPQPGEYGYDTWPKDAYKNERIGAANNWAGMAVDRKRGIIYVPTGSAAPDFYGGDRLGTNLFANCLLALDARTGKRIWHYQFVHHDIQDRDAPAPPNLLTVTHNGKSIDAVAQITKQGFVFLFNRETGAPLFDIKEVPTPASDIPGEKAWPTQPVPVKPAPFARQRLAEEDINPAAPNRNELIQVLRQSRSEGPFTPLSLRGSIVFPGTDGGAEWGGAAVDREGIIYINSNEMPWLMKLVANNQPATEKFTSTGAAVYQTYCTPCHGADKKGNPASGFPSLINIHERKSEAYVQTVVTKGKGMMPAFPKLSAAEQGSLMAYLFGQKEPEASAQKEPVTNAATATSTYLMTGYNKFLDADGYPAVKPPWGTLNAINLNTGEYVWKIPYGETTKGSNTGSESYGGPIVTASGLLIIAGTADGYLRFYDKANGMLLHKILLPAPAFATPVTYEVDGRQYVALACGGTKLGTKGGDSYVAFALPAGVH